MFFLLSQTIMAQKQDTIRFHEYEKSFIDYYEYILQEYTWLIQNVYVGEEPFFIIVKGAYCDTNDNMSLSITYTQFGTILRRIKDSYYYEYDIDRNIYVVIDYSMFFGDSKSILSKKHHPLKLSEEDFIDLFYPITKDRDCEFSYNDKKVVFKFKEIFKNSVFHIEKHGSKISARENGIAVRYFTDYAKKRQQK